MIGYGSIQTTINKSLILSNIAQCWPLRRTHFAGDHQLVPMYVIKVHEWSKWGKIMGGGQDQRYNIMIRTQPGAKARARPRQGLHTKFPRTKKSPRVHDLLFPDLARSSILHLFRSPCLFLLFTTHPTIRLCVGRIDDDADGSFREMWLCLD